MSASGTAALLGVLHTRHSYWSLHQEPPPYSWTVAQLLIHSVINPPDLHQGTLSDHTAGHAWQLHHSQHTSGINVRKKVPDSLILCGVSFKMASEGQEEVDVPINLGDWQHFELFIHIFRNAVHCYL